MVPRTLHRYQYAGADPVNRIDPRGEMDLPSLMTVVQSVATFAAIHSAVVFGGELFKNRVFPTALLAAAETFAVDVVVGVPATVLGGVFLGAIGEVLGAWMGPGMSKLSSAVGKVVGLGGTTLVETLGPVAAQRYYAAVRTIASVFSEISLTASLPA